MRTGKKTGGVSARDRLRRLLRGRKGDAAIEFVMTAAMMILIFATLITAMVYVTQYYSASYICRRAVRAIEVAGEYDATDIRTLAEDLGGDALHNMSITVTAPFVSGGRRIQLHDEFTLRLQAVYRINILQLGEDPVYIELPIQIRLSGRSEVFWK